MLSLQSWLLEEKLLFVPNSLVRLCWWWTLFLEPVSVIRWKRRDRMARKVTPIPLVTELGFIGLAGDALAKGI
jgi:hypothetical protein